MSFMNESACRLDILAWFIIYCVLSGVLNALRAGPVKMAPDSNHVYAQQYIKLAMDRIVCSFI